MIRQQLVLCALLVALTFNSGCTKSAQAPRLLSLALDSTQVTQVDLDSGRVYEYPVIGDRPVVQEGPGFSGDVFSYDFSSDFSRVVMKRESSVLLADKKEAGYVIDDSLSKWLTTKIGGKTFSLITLSADGGLIAISRNQKFTPGSAMVATQKSDLIVLNLSERKVLAKIVGLGTSVRTSFSPDGEWILFSQDVESRRLPESMQLPNNVDARTVLCRQHLGNGKLEYLSPGTLMAKSQDSQSVFVLANEVVGTERVGMIEHRRVDGMLLSKARFKDSEKLFEVPFYNLTLSTVGDSLITGLMTTIVEGRVVGPPVVKEPIFVNAVVKPSPKVSPSKAEFSTFVVGLDPKTGLVRTVCRLERG